MSWENLQGLQRLPPDPKELRGKEVGRVLSDINRVVKDAAKKAGITYEKETKGRNHGALDYLGFIQEEGDIQVIFPEVQKVVAEINKELLENKSSLPQIEVQYIRSSAKVPKPGIIVYIR